VRAAHPGLRPCSAVLIAAFFLPLCGCGKSARPASPDRKLKSLLREGKLVEAEKFCRDLVRKKDSQVSVHRGNLAHILCLRGEAVLVKIGFFDPAKAKEARASEDYAVAAAFFRDAASQCQRVFKDEPEKDWEAFAKVRGTLGLALYRQERVKEAIVELKRAVADDPRLGAAHNTLGLIYHELGKGEAALANFKAALQAEPGLSEAAYNLGLYYQEELEELTKVEAQAREAGSRPPKGTLLRKRAAAREALRYYRRFLIDRPGNRGQGEEVRRRVEQLEKLGGGAQRMPGSATPAA
jgi:tetratricopeptide (TPR) repeat protein